MRRGRFKKAASGHFPIVKLLAAALFFSLIVCILFFACKRSPMEQEVPTTEPTIVQNPDSIAIPGYEVLELKANSTLQTVCLPNPPQNMCFFQISLFLDDGTLLWESDLIEPGDTSAPILLKQPLEKGTYTNAILKYSCYKMDASLSPLNGAQMKVTLWVK